jgi:hypothetical protein
MPDFASTVDFEGHGRLASKDCGNVFVGEDHTIAHNSASAKPSCHFAHTAR